MLSEQQYHQIKAVLARLGMDSSAKVDFLVDRDGQEIASQGEGGEKDGNSEPKSLDITSLVSLGPGNVAATGGMARLIGEKDLATLSQEGERASIHICVIGRLRILPHWLSKCGLSRGCVFDTLKAVARQVLTELRKG